MKQFSALFSIILFFNSISILAQADKKYIKPDYTEIKKMITDKESENYYPVLLNRFQNNDTTITNAQYRLLYFGYVYQDSYDPYWVPKYSKNLNEYYKKPDINNNDCDSIIKYCKLSISDFSLDLRQMKMLGFAYHKKGDLANEKLWYTKWAHLIYVIKSTGSGVDCNNSISVIVINHEHEILKQLGLNFTGQSLTKDKCDYMAVSPNSKNISGLYFDTKILMEMNYKSKILKK